MNSTKRRALAQAELALEHAGKLYPIAARPFLIGRGTPCDLALENTSVSRRHALVTPAGHECWIEDLGSRNGVYVNARCVRRPTPIAAGDLLAIADVTLRVVSDASVTAADFAPQSGVRPMAAGEPSTTASDGFLLFMSAVDHCLLRGRSLEAERLFAQHLGRPAERAASRRSLDARSAEALSLLALRLGEATGSAVWLDFVLRLYASQATVAPRSVVSGMHWLSHRLGGVNRSALGQYLAQLSAKAELRSEERDSLDRLHALSAARFSDCGGSRPRDLPTLETACLDRIRLSPGA